MVDKPQPSVNPADADEFSSAMMFMMSKYMQKHVDGMLPAEVVSFDEDKNLVTVRPMIMIMDTDNQYSSRRQIQVPVFTMGSGDALIRFKIRAGSLGWIKASDRDISLFLQDKKESAPNTPRQFKFSDAVFFPDFLRSFTISNDDSDALMVIQNTNGTVRWSLFENRIDMTAPTINLNGNTRVNGTIDATGNISSDGDVTGVNSQDQTISLVDHPHGYKDSVGLAATPTPEMTEAPGQPFVPSP